MVLTRYRAAFALPQLPSILFLLALLAAPVLPARGQSTDLADLRTRQHEAEARQAKLADVSITIRANAATEGKLYGSITPRDIAEELTKAGHPVEKSEVIMGEGAIRRTGEYDVVIHLHADIEATVKVVVEGEVA